MRAVIWLVVLGVIGALGYVRLAPHDVEAMHQPIEARGDADFAGGARREIEGATLAAADSYMRALPRTDVLAGSIEEGRITYVTRSRVIGFPDYTTIEATEDGVIAYARLRFGQSDMGVNAARLDGLVEALQTRG